MRALHTPVQAQAPASRLAIAGRIRCRSFDRALPAQILFPGVLQRPFGSRSGFLHAKVVQQRQFRVAAKADTELFGQFKELSKTQFYRIWLQGAVFLVVLAAVDAAFSGDWSRTGVISKEVEEGLKPLVIALGVFHIGCATVAAKSAANKQLPVAPAVAKVLAVGFLAMVEVLLKDPEEKR